MRITAVSLPPCSSQYPDDVGSTAVAPPPLLVGSSSVDEVFAAVAVVAAVVAIVVASAAVAAACSAFMPGHQALPPAPSSRFPGLGVPQPPAAAAAAAATRWCSDMSRASPFSSVQSPWTPHSPAPRLLFLFLIFFILLYIFPFL